MINLRKILENLNEKGPGLWANIHKRRKSGKRMRKKGEKGAPSDKNFRSASESVIPEYMTDRTSVSTLNNNRNYSMDPTLTNSYLDVADGGALFGIGMKYSQYNTGQDFSREQWGCSLESNLTSDNPISVFIYVKSRATLLWNQNGVQVIQ